MDRDANFVSLVMEALEVPLEGRVELATHGGLAIQSVIKAVVKQAKRTRLLEEQRDAAMKLADKWKEQERQSAGWFQSHNGNSCAKELRAIFEEKP